jgi:hypothetical protein
MDNNVEPKFFLVTALCLRYFTFVSNLNLFGMKFQLLFFVASFGVITLCSNCKNDPPASAKTADENANTAASADQTATPAIAPTNVPAVTVPTGTQVPNPVAAPNATTTNDVKKPEPAQNAKGVWHYTCAKGCAGGAGAAQACAKCNAMLVHNSTYHENAAPATKPNPASVATTAPADAPKPEPAQNAKGVWHYTCSDGCAGGAGAAAPCAKCGKALVHNSVYHQ